MAMVAISLLFPLPASQIRINFNITMLDLPCEYAAVDVLDVLGTNQQNVTKNIEKWNLDKDGEWQSHDFTSQKTKIAFPTHAEPLIAEDINMPDHYDGGGGGIAMLLDGVE